MLKNGTRKNADRPGAMVQKKVDKPQKAPEDSKYKAAYALNACMVSLSQIVDYNDINILNQEYDILLNNLNLQNIIKDEAMLNALKQILDTCHFYLLHAKDKEMLKKKQAARMKGALGRALGGANVLAIFGTPNPYAIAAGVLAMAGVAAVRYKSERDKAKLENELEEWQLERTALEQLHNLRRTLFETAWRLSEHYDFNDNWRLTERQIKIYNDTLANPDPLGRLESLTLIEDQFEAYPIFWYYKARAALETASAYRTKEMLHEGEVEKTLDYGEDQELYDRFMRESAVALDRFIEIQSKNVIFRTDTLAASAYLDKAFLVKAGASRSKKCCIQKASAGHVFVDNDERALEIMENVDKARSIAGTDLEILQVCATYYLGLHEYFYFSKKNHGQCVENCYKGAKYCLRVLLNEDFNPEINGRWLSRLYLRNKEDCGEGWSRTRPGEDYAFLKASVSRRHAFPYSVILPEAMDGKFFDEIADYLNGDKFLTSLYRYFYGRIRCAFMDFYVARATTIESNSWSSICDFMSRHGKEFSDFVADGWVKSSMEVAFLQVFLHSQFEKETADAMLDADGELLAVLKNRFLVGMWHYHDAPNNSNWSQLCFWKTTSDYDPRDIDHLGSEVEVSLNELAVFCAKHLAECYRIGVAKHKPKNDSDALKFCDELYQRFCFYEQEAERYRIYIKSRECGGRHYAYPEMGVFAHYIIKNKNCIAATPSENGEKYILMEACKRHPTQLKVSVWKHEKDGKAPDSLLVNSTVELKKQFENKGPAEEVYVSDCAHVSFKKPQGEFPFEKVEGFVCQSDNALRYGVNLSRDEDLYRSGERLLYETYQSKVKECIKAKSFFRVGGVPKGRQGEVVDTLEKLIDNELRQHCRVRSENRGYLLGPTIVGGAYIAAHNLWTRDAEYEIVRAMGSDDVIVNYIGNKKDA